MCQYIYTVCYIGLAKVCVNAHMYVCMYVFMYKVKCVSTFPPLNSIRCNYSISIDTLCITWAFRYLRKKSKRNDLPLRKAPATDTTTTFLSLIRSSSRICSNASSSNPNEWSSVATTTCTGLPFNLLPLAETVKEELFFSVLVLACTLDFSRRIGLT